MRFFALLAALISAFSAAGEAPESQARLTFSKSFAGSVPAWEEISVARSGAGLYKEDPKDDEPFKFQLAESECGQMFGLADKLDHFSHSVESPLKVANMGLKTLRYEAGGQSKASEAKFTEVRFNYTEDPDARALAEWFERIADTERGLIKLENAIRFDKLGVQDAILQIEIIRDQKRLVAAEQFLPLLDRVAKNESFMGISRQRASALAAAIRDPR